MQQHLSEGETMRNLRAMAVELVVCGLVLVALAAITPAWLESREQLRAQQAGAK